MKKLILILLYLPFIGFGQSWERTFGGIDFNWAFSVQQTNDNGYIITGQTGVFGNGNVGVRKIDEFGVEQWNQTFGGTDWDEGYSVRQTTDGGYIIAGGTNYDPNIAGTGDVYLIKTDGQGNVTSTFNIPINSNRKLQKTVDILGKQTRPQTNTPFIEIYDDGTVEKRIVIE